MRPTTLKVVAIRVVAIGIGGSVLAQYLAGFVFLLTIHANPSAASPLTIARYAVYYGQRQSIRRKLYMSSAAGFAVLMGLAVSLLLTPKRAPLYGNARFARTREIKAAGLLGNKGIILGRLDRPAIVDWLSARFGRGFQPIVLPGQTGVALAAKPGAGKSVSASIPNLLEWEDSVLATDPKNELYRITAGYRRSMGQEVHLFDPLSREGRTARQNPLFYVSDSPAQRVSDLQLTAHMFWPDPAGGADPFWAAGGRSLFVGIGLYLFETPGMPRTIGEVLRQGMATDEEGFSAHWKRVIQGRMKGSHPLSDTCVRSLYDVIDLAPQTASSIRRTFTSRLELWANPLLDAATSACDFDLRDLRKKPMTIYIGIAPKDMDRLSPLVSLIFQQALALQTDVLPEHDPDLVYQLLLLMEEIPVFGRLPILTKSAGLLRGYSVRLFLIMQTLSQIRDVYGENGAQTLLKTMGARIFFSATDMQDATEVSNELGFTTVKTKTVSKPRSGLGKRSDHQGSVNIGEHKRPLMLPQEIRELPPDREIIFADNVTPISCRKIEYYRIKRYRERLLPPPIVPVIELPTPRARNPAGPSTDSAADAPRTPTRHATAADLERLDSLTLEDFAADFSRVNVPEKAPDERLTPAELDAAVESFLQTLHG
jgi:type IV secretion system protein VirD4